MTKNMFSSLSVVVLSLTLRFATSLNCTNEGQMVAQPNCNQLYKCVAGRYLSYTCKAGEHFSEQLQKCTSIKEANCFCKGLADGMYRYDDGGCYPGSAERYVTCNKQQVVSLDNCTESNFIFNRADPRQSYCSKVVATCHNVTTSFCKTLTPGNYSLPGTCTSYVTCFMGQADGVLNKCPAHGQVFSQKLNACVSDQSYPIDCGGHVGAPYISMDGSTVDFRHHAKAIVPCTVHTGLVEIVSNTLLPPNHITLTSNRYGDVEGACDHKNNQFFVPIDSQTLTSDFTLIEDVRLNVAPSNLSNHDVTSVTIKTTPIDSVLSTLQLVRDNATSVWHFEMSCLCNATASGTIHVVTNVTASNDWHTIKLLYQQNLDTLFIFLSDALHVYHSNFRCYNSCALTSNLALRQHQNTQIYCMMLLQGSNVTGTTFQLQSQVCPRPNVNALCQPSSPSAATFANPVLNVGDRTIMACNVSGVANQKTATVACLQSPIVSKCSWTDFSTFECMEEQRLVDQNELFCYEKNKNDLGLMTSWHPRVIFPFNYITQLRDIAYGLEGKMINTMKQRKITATNELTLDTSSTGRFVMPQDLSLNFASNFHISFFMQTDTGCALYYEDGPVRPFYTSLSVSSSMELDIMVEVVLGHGHVLTDQTNLALPSADLSGWIDIVNSPTGLEIQVNGSTLMSTFFPATKVYGNFYLEAIGNSSNKQCRIACLAFTDDITGPLGSTYRDEYCSSTNLSVYYTTQLNSLLPLNFVTANADILNWNDVENPAYLTYGAFEYIPAPMGPFSAINLDEVMPDKKITIPEPRSGTFEQSEDFTFAFWLYPNETSTILEIFDADRTTSTFKIAMNPSTSSSLTVSLLVETGNAANPFSYESTNIALPFNMNTNPGWYYVSVSLVRHTPLRYQIQANIFSYNRSLTTNVNSIFTNYYTNVSYVRGEKLVIDSSVGYLSCLTYLDRVVYTLADAEFLSSLCPELSSPCDSADSPQLASNFSLPDPSVFDNDLDTYTSTCTDYNHPGAIPVASFCLVDRSIFPPRESCSWSTDSNSFECSANRTLISPPCGSEITVQNLIWDYLSAIRCPVLSPPANGSVSFSDPRCPGGSFATFSCFNGSYLSGDRDLVCNDKGGWNSTVPKCKFADCGDPTAWLLSNFNMTPILDSQSTFYFGSEIAVNCIPGYSGASEPSSIITCQEDKAWSSPKSPCQHGSCGEPRHGFYHIVFGDNFHFNETVSIRCLSGSQFDNGEMNITKRCNESLLWDPETPPPSCVAVACPLPKIGEFATFAPVKLNYSLGESVNVSCVNETFALFGDSKRTCLPDQGWTGATPFCHNRFCADPGDVVGAIKTPSAGNFSWNETVSYSCQDGYNLTSGDTQLRCRSNGLWEGTRPTCSRISCGLPSNASDGSVLFSSTLFNDTALYECAFGFAVASGETVRRCLSNGSWSGRTPVCSEITCDPPQLLNFTEFNSTAKLIYRYGESINATCSPGFRKMDGSIVRTCTYNNTWSGKPLFCLPNECPPPSPRPRMAIYQPIGKSYSAGATVWYTCVYGAFLTNGSMNRTCLPDGMWTGKTPTCAFSTEATGSRFIRPVRLSPVESEYAEEIGIPAGAIFFGSLLMTLAVLDFISAPKYFDLIVRRFRKSGVVNNPPRSWRMRPMFQAAGAQRAPGGVAGALQVQNLHPRFR